MSQLVKRELTNLEWGPKQQGSPQQQTLESQSLQSQAKVEQKFLEIDAESASVEMIMGSLQAIRQQIRRYESLADRKISKYYSELRPQPLDSQKTIEGLVSVLQKERAERHKLITFQELQIKKIQEQQQQFDSKENIEFAIPIEISQTKKAILQLQKFIHIAKIREKKKSQDLVKVEKTNLQQFERTAMLRTNLEHAMLYEINLNQRQMAIDEHMYDFQTKIEALNRKLQDLGRTVQQKQILVSSNKSLLILREKKNKLMRCKQEELKRIGIMKSNFSKSIATLSKDIEALKDDIKLKVIRAQELEQSISHISQGDQQYLDNRELTKLLKKNIAFSYAETLLRLKKQDKISRQAPLTERGEKQLEKPNFKIKRLFKRSEFQSVQQKMKPDKKVSLRYEDLLLPSSHSQNPENDPLRKPVYSRNTSMVISRGDREKEQNLSEIISEK